MELTAEQMQLLSEAWSYGFGTVLFFAILGILLSNVLSIIKR